MTSHGWEAGIEQRSALGGRHPLGWNVHPRIPLGRFTPSPTKAPLDTENTLQRRAAEIVGLPPELGDGSAFTTFSADVETVLTTVPEKAVQSLPLPEPPVTVAESHPPPEPISRDIPETLPRDVPETLPTATTPIDLPSGSSDRTAVSAQPIPPETFPPPVQRQPLGQSQPLGFHKPELSTQASLTASPDPFPDVIPQTPSPSSQPSSPSSSGTLSPKRPVSLQPAAPSDPAAAVIDSDTFSQPVSTPETVQTVEESTETAPPSETASPVEPMRPDAPPSPPPDSTEAALPVVAPTATPDSTQEALPSPSQTRPSQTSAQDIVHRQSLEPPPQKADIATPDAIDDATDKVQTPATIQSKENELGTEDLERSTPPLSVEPPTALQRLDTPEGSPDSKTGQQQPKSTGLAAQPPEQDSARAAETQTPEDLPPIQRWSLETVQPNTETPTTPTEVTPVEPVAPRAISPQTDPASPPAQLTPKAAPSPPADVSTAEPSSSASPSPKTPPDRPSVAAETPIQDGHDYQTTSYQIPGSADKRGKGEPEQPTLPTVHRVPLGQTAPIGPLARAVDIDLSGLSTISPEPTPTKVSQTGETQSFLNPTEKTDPIQKRAAPQHFETQQSDVSEAPETEPEPWTAQFNLEPPKSKTPASFLLPDQVEETVLSQIRAVEGETEETVAIKPPGEPDMASQASDSITVVSPFATQQASSDEEQLEHLAQLMYGQLRSHLHQLHESRHGRAIPLATLTPIGTAVWPLPLHQLATVVRQQVESRLRSDLERRPIHHR